MTFHLRLSRQKISLLNIESIWSPNKQIATKIAVGSDPSGTYNPLDKCNFTKVQIRYNWQLFTALNRRKA